MPPHCETRDAIPDNEEGTWLYVKWEKFAEAVDRTRETGAAATESSQLFPPCNPRLTYPTYIFVSLYLR